MINTSDNWLKYVEVDASRLKWILQVPYIDSAGNCDLGKYTGNWDFGVYTIGICVYEVRSVHNSKRGIASNVNKSSALHYLVYRTDLFGWINRGINISVNLSHES